MNDPSQTGDDGESLLAAAAEAAQPDDPIPQPGEVVERAIPKKDPDRFTWPPRPSLVMAGFVAVISAIVVLRGNAWGLPGFAIAAFLVVWPRIRAFFEFGGSGKVPRVRGGVTEPVELDPDAKE